MVYWSRVTIFLILFSTYVYVYISAFRIILIDADICNIVAFWWISLREEDDPVYSGSETRTFFNLEMLLSKFE